MDLRKTIAELYQEKARLDKVIASLEQLSEEPSAIVSGTHRRGRRFMSPQERKQVSERMRRYWAARRTTKEAEPSRTMTAASAA